MQPAENRHPDRARLILALARARGWKIPSGAVGTTPAAVLGARWEAAAPWEREAFERELAGMEAEPGLMAALLGIADEPGSVRISQPQAGVKTRVPGGAGPDEEAPLGTARGKYEVMKEHARGGMGRVLVVLDREVGREVAMKELLPKYAQGFAWDRERFLREARITGQLEHPNIVPVYEIGSEDGGAAYYTMKLVRGETMEARLERAKADGRLTAKQRLAERLKLLDAFIDACNAVAYAHSRWIVNRDLKPANIMIGDFGETVVLDWGLARKLGQEEPPPPSRPGAAPGAEPSKGDTTRLTMDGDIMGTPAYMSPEQARGETDLVDEKSDVYALGVMLYEIVTGKPPFETATGLETLKAVIYRNPPAADVVEPLAPPELAAVAAAAMAKDRSRRLSSAQTLAEEVKAWRDGRAMTLYKHTTLEQVRRFARHNGALALALSGALLILLVGTAISLWYAHLASENAKAEHEARSEADMQTDEARRSKQSAQAALQLAQGQRLAAYSLNLIEENTTAALLVGIESARLAPGSASTNALWSSLSQLVERQRFLNHGHNVCDGNFSPDGKLVATAGADFTARIWEVATGKELQRLEGHTSGVTIADWSADGKLLLTVPGHPEEDRIKAFQPAGCVDVAPRIWDTGTGKCLHVLRGHTGFLRGAAWAPGGRVLSWGDDRTVRLWDAEGNATVFKAPSWVAVAAISPDGRWLAGWSENAKGWLWRTDEPGTFRELTGHTRWFNASFSPDSRFIVTADHDGRILRRDVETLSILQEIHLDGPDPKNPQGPPVPIGPILGVLHHPDGKRLAFQSNFSLHIWAADLSRELARVHFEYGRLWPKMLDADWKRALIVDGATARERDLSTGDDLAWFRGHEYNLEFAHFSPDGRRVVTGGRDHAAIVWDAEPGACLPTFRWHTTRPQAVLSHDGSVALLQGADGRIEVHDNATGKQLAALDFQGKAGDLRFFGDGHRFAVRAPNSKTVRIGDTARGWLLDADCGGSETRILKASANGDWLLVIGFEEDARLWNLVTGKGGPVFKAPPRTYDFLAVSDDGRSLAMVRSSEARVVVYDTSDLHETASLAGHSGWTIGSAFAADGTVLTTAMDATVRAWDPKTATSLRSGRWPLIQETFIVLPPAGRVLALDGGGTARFYSLDTLDEIAALPRSFSTPVGFTPDGRFAAARRAGAVVQLPMEALAFAESVVPRELTPLEQRGMADTRGEADAYSQAYYKRHPRAETFLGRAERLLADGKWEEALLQVREATALLPAHPVAFELAARAHAIHAGILAESDPARAAAIEEGVKAIEAAEERGYRDVKTLEEDGAFAVLRSHPRWKPLVARAKQTPWDSR